MKDILSKAKIHKTSLRSTVVKIAATELNRLSEPCYYPAFHKYQYDLYRELGIQEKDISEFIKRFWAGTKWAKFLLIKDTFTNLIIVVMCYFLQEKDDTAFKYTMYLYMIRVYTNLMNRQIKFCNPDVFKYSIEHLNKTHLFSREKTIPSSIMFLANELIKRYKKYLTEFNVDKTGAFVQEARTRMSQSIKSFATLYYKASEEGSGVRSSFEGDDTGDNAYQYETTKKSERLIDEVTKKITVYKYVDKKALNDAKTISKIKMSIATLLANQITDISYSDNIKSIYRLFLKDLTNVKGLCGSGFVSYVKKLMSIKRTTELVYFKQQVNVLLMKLVKKIDFEDKYNKLTPQSQFNINTFIAYYITMILRNTLC